MTEENTIRINRDTLVHFQRINCLTNDALAARAEVSLSTIQRARRGEPIGLGNVQAIAQALGIPAKALTAEPPRAVQQHIDESRVAITLKIAVPFDQFVAENRLPKFTTDLRRAIHADNIIITPSNGLRPGSTHLDFDMARSDVLRLLAATMDGILSALDVTWITLQDDNWLQLIPKLLMTIGTPIEPDPDTVGDILDEGAPP